MMWLHRAHYHGKVILLLSDFSAHEPPAPRYIEVVPAAE
jgi:hypothetical protein